MSAARSVGWPGLHISVWEDGANLRVGDFVLQLKGPTMAPLYSERNGRKEVVLRFRGWRLLWSCDDFWRRRT
jgi:hypothetical protein